MAYALGIDVGTTNVKVALVADDPRTGAAQRALTVTHGPGTAEQDADATVGRARRRRARGHRRAPGRGGRRRARSASAASTRRSSRSTRRARPLAPMLMWQDQRGTDHWFAIMAPRRRRVLDVRRAPRHPARRRRACRSRTSSTCNTTGPRCTTAHRRLRRGDGLRHRAPAPGGITATQHSTFMYQLCDNRTLDPPAYDDELVRARRRRRHPAAAAGRDRRRGRRAAARRRAASSASRRPRPCTRGTNDTATAAVATGAFAAGPGRHLDRHHQRARRRGRPTSASTSTTRSSRCPRPYPDRYVVCAENGLGGKVARARAANARLRGRRARRPPRRRSLRRARPRRSTRPCAGAGGVMFLPVARRGAAHRRASGSMRGGFVNMSLEHRPARDLVRAVVEGVAHNLRVAAAAGRGVHRARRSTRSRSSAARPGRAPGARSSPTCSTARWSRSTAPDVAIARATALLALAARTALWSRADLDREPRGPAPRFEPDPRHRSLFADRHGAVRGCLRCPPPDQ